MTDVFLGVIAFATVTMAIVQVLIVLHAARLARRVDVLSTRVETELQPIAERLRAVSENAQQISVLAAAQFERVDHLVSSLSRRIDETVGLLQHSLVGPLREGMAVVAAFRGVVAAVRSFRGGDGLREETGPRFDEEDPLFIG
ncbi:MAG: hypothetical protein AB1806_00355 [Acidobacteriota bacterium]